MHVSGFSRSPSSAPAEVTVVSGRFWQIVSCQREDKSIVLQRVAEKSVAFFVCFCPATRGKRPVRTPVSKNIGSGGDPADVPSPPAQFCSESKGTPKGGYVQVVSLRLWDRFLSCVWRSETRAPRVRF